MLLYSTGNGVVSDIPAGQVPSCMGSLDDKAISVQVDIVKNCFLVDQLPISTDARDATTAALGLSEEAGALESDGDEYNIE